MILLFFKKTIQQFVVAKEKILAVFASIAFVFGVFWLKLRAAKQQGRNEVIADLQTKTVQNIRTDSQIKEKVQDEFEPIVTGMSDSWDTVRELRKKGLRSMRQIADAKVRKTVGKIKK